MKTAGASDTTQHSRVPIQKDLPKQNRVVNKKGFFLSYRYELCKHLRSNPFSTIGWNGIHPKNHLPASLFIMQGRILIHQIGQIFFLRAETVHKGNELIFFIQKEKMISVEL